LCKIAKDKIKSKRNKDLRFNDLPFVRGAMLVKYI
jgi:hypothetical protein